MLRLQLDLLKDKAMILRMDFNRRNISFLYIFIYMTQIKSTNGKLFCFWFNHRYGQLIPVSYSPTFNKYFNRWKSYKSISCLLYLSTGSCIGSYGSNGSDVRILNQLNESSCITIDGRSSDKETQITKIGVNTSCRDGPDVNNNLFRCQIVIKLSVIRTRLNISNLSWKFGD